MSVRLVLALSLLGPAGCAVLQPSATLLDRADRMVERGDYAGALQTYDELLARYPSDRLATRAQTSRQTVTNLLAARADVARLRHELTARDAELSRLKQDLERLREDLENMKKIDLRERRR
ncbi:MAG: tetratricopeptide repeat protein [Candidatus Rokuibacteriota bacterium]